MATQTTEQFIQKAIIVHGDIYDYSKVIYKDNKTKVEIICHTHGSWFQKPNNHSDLKQGCLKCYREKILVPKINGTSEFIKKSVIIHGDKYDYSKVEYKNCETKVEIMCPNHGSWFQRPKSHLRKHACPKCHEPQRGNTNDFIKKARLIHEDKYNYSKTIYINSYTKVEILCAQAHVFWQKPNDHLNNHGCPQCGNHRGNTDDFIKKARLIHGNKYDYLKTHYVSAKTKIEIKCKDHGLFWQKPNDHLYKKGCFKCAVADRRSNTHEFVEKTKLSIHGDKYDYSLVEYKTSKIKVEIVCKTHGSFWQKPNDHLSGYGCAQCGSNKSNTEEFIEKAKIIHSNKYEYNKVHYKKYDVRVEITCLKHGEFFQTPEIHLNNHGCPTCGGVRKSNTDDFIKKAKLVHGDKYDYINISYINVRTKVQIICKKHGTFDQKPNDHINGYGCQTCSHYISKPEIDWLNSLNVLNDKYHRQVRIKINNKTYSVDGYDPITNTIYEFDGDFFHGNPEIYNLEDINPVTKTTFRYLYENTYEKHRQIKNAGYNLIAIWENSWKKQLAIA